MFEEPPKTRLSFLEKLKITLICSVGAMIWGAVFVGAIKGLMQSF
tara:strand:+ start:135 stop:269 length:135 start_codon:yes stop_codon:yes gene_type:complete